jgi:hypothetical protein
MQPLSEREAYAAMFVFLDARYKRRPSDELGALPGSMSLLPDGRPTDPALWSDWIEAITKATSGEVEPQLKLAK